MAFGLKNNRSRSTSNILDQEISSASQRVSQNRYRTYTIEELNINKEYLARQLLGEINRAKEPTTPRSQNFVKKLIASLERKNEECKADDEFFTRYYRKSGSFNSIHDDDNEYENVCNRKLNTNGPYYETIDKFLIHSEGETKHDLSGNKISRSKSETKEFGSRVSKKDNDMNKISDKSVGRSINKGEINDSVRRNSKIHEHGSHCDVNEARRYSDQFLLQKELKNSLRARNVKNLCDLSSLDPTRPPIEMNHFGSLDSPLRKNKEKQNKTKSKKANKEENISLLINSSVDGALDRRSTKKLPRRKSFKDFLSSVMRWKKSETKGKPRRFISCVNLNEEAPRHTLTNLEETNEFPDSEKEILQSGNRNATIRPIYGKRSEFLRAFDEPRKITYPKNYGIFASEETVESLVKPSAIKNIVRRLSQTEASYSDRNHDRKSVIERNYKGNSVLNAPYGFL